MGAVEDVLAHHGIKGMRWGVKGGKGTPTAGSDDAKRAAASKEIVKKSGVKALNNQELQHLVNRINLEQQYKRLNPSNKEKAARFAADLLLGVGKQQVTRIASDIATKQVTNLLKKAG